MAKRNSKHINPHYQPPDNKKKLAGNLERFNQGLMLVQAEPIFSYMFSHIRVDLKSHHCPRTAWAVVTSDGVIHPNLGRMAEPNTWAYIIAHCVLHLGLGHFEEKYDQTAWNLACDYVIARFLANFKLGEPPVFLPELQLPGKTEDDLYAWFLEEGIPKDAKAFGLTEEYTCDLEFVATSRFSHMVNPPVFTEVFAWGLRQAMRTALVKVSNTTNSTTSLLMEVKQWFINNYPLLGALVAGFDIIEDQQACHAMEISIAAVDSSTKRIYFNPAAYGYERNRHWSDNFAPKLNGKEEIKFVMAHEILHVALRHQARRQGRDPYLWNIACDYVINDWLIQMGVGRQPEGVLFDPELRGLNAESVYDRIVNDIRTYKKLATLRGVGLCDMLEGTTPEWWEAGEGIRLDEFYRRAFAQGFEYHTRTNRGFLPAGLIEEIRAVTQPSIPWDVELAQWFDARFPPLEKRRSYARPSRRQSATPDIPRPQYVLSEAEAKTRTFGVVLDTSGSMENSLLAKALGSIASYSQARDVQAVRVVFCDAAPYDAGYMLPEDIAERVQIKGRGGTILQPGIDLLERDDDFPSTGPILIITDGFCDVLRVRRDHAFLVPAGNRLPFTPQGEVFYFR